CGALLAKWGVRLLVALSAANLPRVDEVGINASVLAFTLAVSLLTGLLFGLVPAWQSARLDLTDALKEGGRGAAGAARPHALSLLVVGEVAMAIVLLISAGLLVNSFVRLQRVSPGFDQENLLTVRVDLPNPYAEPEKKAVFFEQLQERVAALPGVQAVGLVTELPLARQSADFSFKIEDRKSTRLNSSHEWISYAVFCLKKKTGHVVGELGGAVQQRVGTPLQRDAVVHPVESVVGRVLGKGLEVVQDQNKLIVHTLDLLA